MIRWTRLHIGFVARSKCVRMGVGVAVAVIHSASFTSGQPAAACGVTDASEARQVVPGGPSERAMSGGQHIYECQLESGQYVRVDVLQRGVDLVVKLRAPDGVVRADVDDSSQETEHVHVVAAPPGTYRVEVAPRVNGLIAGGYRIGIGDARAATTLDHDRAAAEASHAQAHALRLGTGDARRQAVQKYTDVLAEWTKVGDARRAAQTLYYLGQTHRLLGERPAALERYGQALTRFRSLQDLAFTARTLHAIGTVQVESEAYAAALAVLDETVALSRDAGDELTGAAALFWIGRAHSLRGDQTNALSFYGEALPRFRAMGDRQNEAATLNGIAISHRLFAEWPQAIERYREALTVWRAAGDRRGEAITLGNMGNVFQEMGDYQRAQESHYQALELHRLEQNRAAQANVLTSIGWTRWLLGDNQEALEYHNQALRIAREVGNRGVEGIVLNNIGLAQAATGRIDEALQSYEQALTLKRSVDDRRGEAFTLQDIGIARWAQGRYPTALEYLDQALALHRRVGDRQGEGETLSSIGLTWESMDDHQKALASYRESLAVQRAIGDRRNEATTLLGMARAHRDLGSLADAQAHVLESLVIIEQIRANVVRQDLRAAFMASRRNAYDLYVDILMRMHDASPTAGHAARALLASERGRARTLYEALSDAYADIREGVDPQTLQRERDLRRQVDAQSQRLVNVLSGQHDEEQAAAARRAVETALVEHERARADIRASGSRYAALTDPPTLSIEQVQGLLDADSLLLEYSLGDERSFLWAVTPASVTSYVLPKREQIERASRDVYERLTARNVRPAGETAPLRRARIARADSEYPQAATELSRLLLAPAAELLTRRRLIVVAEGALQYVPFSALPLPPGATASAKGNLVGDPLAASHEVVNLPSLSVLEVLRREFQGRERASHAVAVLADPVFSSDDARVAAGTTSKTVTAETSSARRHGVEGGQAELTRSAADAGVERFTRLRFTREEADTILRLTPLATSLKAVDFAASLQTATDTALSRYRIVHFATHGLINSVHPELSGLVLSLVDSRGQPQDGFLRLNEIYNLRLGADLVVLSACQTALGKDIRGEGLIGLTRGFMYAGAPRVVASVWDVEDRATAELMKRFYEGMLVGGQPAAAAMSGAQRALMRDRRWAHPYYWSGFVMQGEWR